MIGTGVEREKRTKYILRRKRKRIFIIIGVVIVCVGIFFIPKVLKKSNVIYLERLNRGKYSIKKLQKKQADYENNLEVKTIDYEKNGDLELGNKPKYLVYHHTASKKLAPEKLNEIHIKNGWGEIGYHYYIRKDGTVYKGRPEEAVGAHAIGKNRDSIGICLEGDFESERPTNAEIQSLIKLSVDMIIKYNIETSMEHKEVYNTLCPGKNFDINKIKGDVADELLNMIKE